MKIYLVGCSKSKLDHAAPAADLYGPSQLFRMSRAYVASVLEEGDHWFVLSARHGLVSPITVLEPYEWKLRGRSNRTLWAGGVFEQLLVRFAGRDPRFIILAGRDYAEPLDMMLEPMGPIEQPLRGMGIGQRMKWLKEATR